MDELLRDFLTETHENIDVVDVELVRFEQNPNDATILNNVFRLVHTIKGTCGFLNLPRLEALTHAAETLMSKFRDGTPVTGEAVTLVLASIDRVKMLLDQLEKNEVEPAGDDKDLVEALGRVSAAVGSAPKELKDSQPSEDIIEQLERTNRSAPAPHIRSAPQAPSLAVQIDPTDGDDADRRDDGRSDSRIANQSIRVNVDTLEHLMTMVSELVLTRNQLLDIGRRNVDTEFKAPLQRLSSVTAELQEGVMKTRMQPIGTAWQKLPRIVRDLSTELGKPVELVMQGAETELDRQVLDLIKDPLIHMVRNSADHGLEMPADRRVAGKPEQGTIRLAAWHEGGYIVVEVADDGRGLDTARIKELAIARGLVSAPDADAMTDLQIQQFIFFPGFSTSAKITSVSGRGVGMDVVRANLNQIGGAIEVRSVFGQGTSFILKIPLTLAIVSALIVQSDGDRFAIPQFAVTELVRARKDSEHRIERIKGAAVLRLRNKLLPLFRLSTLLMINTAVDDDVGIGFIVVMQVGGQSFGIVVDAVFHTEEIVVKPMSGKLRNIPMFCGNTILGDGAVILIIDPNGVAQQLVGTTSRQLTAETASTPETTGAAAESMLLFRAGSPQLKAVPLSLVTRLEVVDPKKIERADNRSVLQYRGQLIPLILANSDMKIRESGGQPLLVFSNENRSMALVVDEIVDIVEEQFAVELESATAGILGSAVIKGQATEVIDIAHYLPLAFEDWQTWQDQRPTASPSQVLLVDDAAFFRNMLAPVLRAAGFVVTTASSANEALALLQGGRRFDVVVTDIDMPERDGFALTSEVRANPRTANLPVIGLSTLISAEAIERGRQVGLHDYVAKFDRPGLIAALKEQTAGLAKAA